MRRAGRWLVGAVVIAVGGSLAVGSAAAAEKKRLFVVSSYHREYLWSQETNRGLTDALLRFGYLDNHAQAEEYTAHDAVESSKAVIQKAWMDTKRKNTLSDIAQATERIMKAIAAFKPDLVLLGDDNAANYIGNQLLDTPTPVVFWGINGIPMKYGLIDSMERPGHNVTGVWQSGYYRESLELLHQLVPQAKTFAILACDSETTRPKIKIIQALAEEGALPLKLVEVVATNSFPEFQAKALEAAQHVDAFFILNHDTLHDEDAQGAPIEMLTVGRWYLAHINKPETSDEGQFAREGMLCVADDSGYRQGAIAVEMAMDILEHGADPSRMKPRTPPRGPLMVNARRAQMLGISLEGSKGVVEEVVEEALALPASAQQ